MKRFVYFVALMAVIVTAAAADRESRWKHYSSLQLSGAVNRKWTPTDILGNRFQADALRLTMAADSSGAAAGNIDITVTIYWNATGSTYQTGPATATDSQTVNLQMFEALGGLTIWKWYYGPISDTVRVTSEATCLGEIEAIKY